MAENIVNSINLKQNGAIIDVNILEKILLLQVDFDLWTGQSVLTSSDIQSLNPETAVKVLKSNEGSNGRKNLIDRIYLKPFTTIRDALKSELDRIGIRFCAGWAIPTSERARVRSLVKDVKEQFDRELAAFVDQYPTHLEAWCRDHPELAQGIQWAAPSQARLLELFKMESFLYPVGGTIANDEESEEERRQMEEALRARFIFEAVRQASRLYEEFCRSMPFGTSPLLRHGQVLSRKVRNLAFLKPEMRKVADTLDDLLIRFGPDNRIEGRDFVRLAAAMKIFSKTESFLAFLDGQATVEGFVPQVEPGIEAAIDKAGTLPDLLKQHGIERRVTPNLVRDVLEGTKTIEDLKREGAQKTPKASSQAPKAAARKAKPAKPAARKAKAAAPSPAPQDPMSDLTALLGDASVDAPKGVSTRKAPAPKPKAEAPREPVFDPNDPFADLTAMLVGN